MTNTPTDAELRKLAEECGIGWAAGLGGMNDFLSAFARAVLAKWGTLHAEKIVIPTDTMEQEFQKHYRRGYEAGQKAAQGGTP